MRVVLIALGVLLICAGGAIGLQLVSYPTEHEVVKVGNMSASLTRERPIPLWLGGVTALTGLIIVVLGTRYRR
jgi:hypothetical protein